MPRSMALAGSLPCIPRIWADRHAAFERSQRCKVSDFHDDLIRAAIPRLDAAARARKGLRKMLTFAFRPGLFWHRGYFAGRLSRHFTESQRAERRFYNEAIPWRRLAAAPPHTAALARSFLNGFHTERRYQQPLLPCLWAPDGQERPP